MKVVFTDTFFKSLKKINSPWHRFWYDYGPGMWKLQLKCLYYRAFKWYDYRCYWEAKTYLSKHIYEALKAFKENERVGYQILDGYCDKKNHTSKKGAKEAWEKELTDMVEGWRMLYTFDDIEDQIHNKVKKRYKKLGKLEKRKDGIFKGIDSLPSKAYDEIFKETKQVEEEAKRKASKLIEHIFALWD